MLPAQRSQPLPHSQRGRIGIITGSGPEAGIDLWQKLLAASRELQQDLYRGDLDAPHTEIVSHPGLGYSMELEANDLLVWPTLEKTVLRLDGQVNHFAIACNTLNYYHRQIERLPIRAQLVSTPMVIRDHLRRLGVERVGLLGAWPVMRLDPWSVYTELAREFVIETPANPEAVQRLIYDIKRQGGSSPTVKEAFSNLLATMDTDIVLLACTELPLVHSDNSNHNCIDVTRLLAQRLAQLSLYGE